MVPFNYRLLNVVAFVTVGFLATVACGSSGGSTAGVENAPATPGAETTGGEAPAVPYTDARYHYRIDAPGRMTSNSDGTAAYVGPSERLEISIVQGSGASNPGALASQDIKSLAASAPAFHELSNPESLTLSGYHVTRFAYTWNPGTSAVTGKAIQLTSIRYYLSKDSTTVAVITYGIVSNQFDPQGADDIVSTFHWQ